VVDQGYDANLRKNVVCKDNICDMLEKYRYLHSGYYSEQISVTKLPTVSSVDNPLYCPEDCTGSPK